jgi:RNA polymerase sigma factor (sigma-70 family)
MSNLTELVRQYKKTKRKNILNEVFKLIDKNLQKRAEYLFYQQKFKINKKVVRLSEIKKVELEDITQELRLAVLKLIEKYDVKKPFENYFYSSLQFWFPEFIRQRNSRESLGILTESEMTTEENESSVFDNLTTQPIYPEEELDVDTMFDDLSDMEKKVVDLLSQFPEKNQSEVAEILEVTPQRVNEIILNLRKKYKHP